MAVQKTVGNITLSAEVATTLAENAQKLDAETVTAVWTYREEECRKIKETIEGPTSP